MAITRTILHLDMDAFFASVEQFDRPELKGKPVLVGYDGPRGVVAAASYEARRFGCHSAQPMAVAKRACPTAIIVPVRGRRYGEVSEKMFAILDDYSPLIEPLSIDEAFIDATGNERLFGPPEQMARRIKDRIKSELHLTASIGIAPNKFLAKLASDLKKPDGLVVIRPGDIDVILPPLPVTKIWGVGPATAARLAEIGVRTIADLRAVSGDRLKRAFGDEGTHFLRLAYGIDERPVVSDREVKSIGSEHTFGVDLENPDEVRRVLLDEVEQVARRLRRNKMLARCVSLKIRFGDFETISRSATLDHHTDGTSELWTAASAIFDRWAEKSFVPVRLIGMTAEQLSTTEGQLGLFGQGERDKQRRVDEATDRIVNKFGKGAIRRGG